MRFCELFQSVHGIWKMWTAWKIYLPESGILRKHMMKLGAWIISSCVNTLALIKSLWFKFTAIILTPILFQIEKDHRESHYPQSSYEVVHSGCMKPSDLFCGSLTLFWQILSYWTKRKAYAITSSQNIHELCICIACFFLSGMDV